MTAQMATDYVKALEAMFSRRYLSESVGLIISDLANEPSSAAIKALEFLDRMAESNSDEAKGYRSLPSPKVAVRIVREQAAKSREVESEENSKENRRHDSAYHEALRSSDIGKEVMASLRRTERGGDDVFISEANRLHNLFPHCGFDLVASKRVEMVGALRHTIAA